MWKKIERYYWTLKYLKKSQFFYLVKRRLEKNRKAVTMLQAPKPRKLYLWMKGLDESPEYLKRFDVDEILKGQITLLYESGSPGGVNWTNPDRSHLWNFNLHYLEYLIPLSAAYRRSAEKRYYECFRDYCRRWIQDNRGGTGDGWHPYTISLRLTNLWICMDGFGDILQKDQDFFQELNNSMYAQYCHLRKRLECHLLGNHYFENLKTVLLGAFYFQEPSVYRKYKKKFAEEIREQILPDGIHYERSMMYHKIILEDIMRVEKALKSRNPGGLYAEGNTGLKKVMQKMTDAAYSLEEGMGQTPLFNDSGDNVAKPLLALLETAKEEFRITPRERRSFSAAGYYCLRTGDLKIVFDAGEIAPDHMPGHGHCDGLSFELSWKGKPFLVNSGTGQYQGEFRSWYRSTAAHNTVVIEDQEQSECWGEHRVGKRITSVSGSCGEKWTEGSLITCKGQYHKRRIELEGYEVTVLDRVQGRVCGYFHLAPGYKYVLQGQCVLVFDRKGTEVCRIQAMPEDQIRIYKKGIMCSYAPEFGKTEQIQVLEIAWDCAGAEHRTQMEFIQ